MNAFDFKKLAQVQFKVSSLTIEATAAANVMQAEVESLALEAFKLRVHGLGLSELQIARAFRGSVLFVRYVREPLGLSDSRQAFVNGQMKQYLDLGLQQVVCYYRRALDAKTDLEALRTEARKELAQTKKTFGKELIAA